MSVLECSRRGCDEIMCNVLIDNRYICGDCLREFESKIGSKEMLFPEMVSEFHSFMASEKQFNPFSDTVDIGMFVSYWCERNSSNDRPQ